MKDDPAKVRAAPSVATAGQPKPVQPFAPYPNHDSYTVALLLENERVTHDKLMLACREASFRLTGAELRKAVGDLSRYPAWPDPSDDAQIDLEAVDWDLIARHWNEDARESAAYASEIAMTGKLGAVIPVLETISVLPPGEGSPGWLIKLPGKLDREVYAAVNKVLEGLGGKWNRKLGGHLYPAVDDPREAIENVIETGSFKKPYNLGYFPTPAALADEVAAKAALRDGLRVLEPSIGQGHLADAVVRACPGVQLTGFELNAKNIAGIGGRHAVVEGDFLAMQPVPTFDRVVMNPPFEKAQEVAHVIHAYDFLKDEGRLVSIMASSIQFRSDKRYASLRTAIGILGGIIEPNPDSAFRESGTDVRTVTVCVDQAPGVRLRDVCDLVASGKLTAAATLGDVAEMLAAQRARAVAVAAPQAAPALAVS